MMDERIIWEYLEEVFDPEVPVLSIVDLGIVRSVYITEGGAVEITITPTYSGCPAMDTIAADIHQKMKDKGIGILSIKTVLFPAWTTDWLSENGRKKLLAFGIAPPMGSSKDKNSILGEEKYIPCPLCGSTNTVLLSQFGSTACKALYRCNQCLEPFDYFKCH
jgi:ring-1,2-phenylacetyl-CoA epoxidase subunit PaaD